MSDDRFAEEFAAKVAAAAAIGLRIGMLKVISDDENEDD